MDRGPFCTCGDISDGVCADCLWWNSPEEVEYRERMMQATVDYIFKPNAFLAALKRLSKEA